MNNEINPIEEDFNAALSRYKTGQDLIPIVQDFQKIIQQIPNHFAAWTCLSWLQLLLKNNEEALYSARQAVRLNQQDPHKSIKSENTLYLKKCNFGLNLL